MWLDFSTVAEGWHVRRVRRRHRRFGDLDRRNLNGGVLRNRGGVPHPPAFCKKSPQVAENKERELEKERQENPRGGKPLRINVLPQMHLGARIRNEVRTPHPGATQMLIKGKRLREKQFVRP